ncbi:MAG: hypothetical protein WC517_02855 [Patescibacteria group bacterium]
MTSKASITDLFKSPDAGLLGIDKKASDLMIAGLNANTLPMCIGTPVEELVSDDVTIIQFFIDASPSMEDVADLFRETFNEIMIEGLRGSSKHTANAIVVAAIAFSSNIWPMFGGGFHALSELGKMTKKEYDPSRGSATNLYEAMMQSITAASAYAANVLQVNGTPPKVIVAGLTDGGDNCNRASRDDVKTLTSALSGELYKFPLAVFETYDTVDGQQLAQETGFEVFEFKKKAGETDADVRKRFRHMIGTMSSSMIAASQTKIGTTSKSGFWTPGA